jgi:hypothetical protein
MPAGERGEVQGGESGRAASRGAGRCRGRASVGRVGAPRALPAAPRPRLRRTRPPAAYVARPCEQPPARLRACVTMPATDPTPTIAAAACSGSSAPSAPPPSSVAPKKTAPAAPITAGVTDAATPQPRCWKTRRETTMDARVTMPFGDEERGWGGCVGAGFWGWVGLRGGRGQGIERHACTCMCTNRPPKPHTRTHTRTTYTRKHALLSDEHLSQTATAPSLTAHTDPTPVRPKTTHLCRWTHPPELTGSPALSGAGSAAAPSRQTQTACGKMRTRAARTARPPTPPARRPWGKAAPLRPQQEPSPYASH